MRHFPWRTGPTLPPELGSELLPYSPHSLQPPGGLTTNAPHIRNPPMPLTAHPIPNRFLVSNLIPCDCGVSQFLFPSLYSGGNKLSWGGLPILKEQESDPQAPCFQDAVPVSHLSFSPSSSGWATLSWFLSIPCYTLSPGLI